MKAVFLFKDKTFTIEVPLWLHHLSQLSNRIASLTIDTMIEDFFNGIDNGEDEDIDMEAYDYLTVECARIFAENQNINSEDLFIEFLVSSDELGKEFGAIINVLTTEDIKAEYEASIKS